VTGPKSKPAADLIVVGASELVTCAGPGPHCGSDQARVGVIEEGAVAAHRGTISWVGPEWELERAVELQPGATRLDVQDRAILPGLVDPHTHAVYAGDRADEFEKRLAGVSYSQIAAEGGGILRTVARTREASTHELRDSASQRLQRLVSFGVTAVEIKSGYGLSLESELKILEVIEALSRQSAQQLVATFLGAHTFPREARGSSSDKQRYLDLICQEMIPQLVERNLAKFIDVFVDDHAFSLSEARRVLTVGRDHGLGLKLHADQLKHDGAAELAAELGAISADHLDYVSPVGLEQLARSQTVAVLLPTASLFLRMNRHPDARAMIERGVPVAVATDHNPGTSPTYSLPAAMQLACLLCGLSVDEAIVAATINAAHAAGLADRAGSIEVGKRCDLVVLDSKERRQLLYQLASPSLHMVIAGGRVVA
jgi:imidazolonepropionase